MGRLRFFWRSIFDVRAGEGWRLSFMALYLVLVLFAYYILKPVSRAMFLNNFDIDKLPYLYIVIAAAGGVMAYFYTKLALHSSLRAAVNVCTFFMAGSLVLIWHLLTYQWDWMLYVFNAFVSLFSITLVSQGWLIAANVFTTREAKRLYGILGVGSVIGAAFGGTFTTFTVYYVGTRNLLLASASLVILAWLAFLAVIRQEGVKVREARGAEEEEEPFSFSDITNAIARYRHLQVIIAIMTLTYVVDVTVDFQFSAMAQERYAGNQRALTAFLGSFYGIWLNLITFVLQFFLTTFVVSHFGVGGALQIMPVSIGIASVASFLSPGVWSTGAARLTEAATRYSFNRTGMELLYLPLPRELRNRTKAFTDVFVDRFARGIGGLILILTGLLNLTISQLSLLVVGYSAVWILLSIRARKEYVTTVRKRLQLGRLDLDSLRVNVNDAATLRLLETTAESENPRQAVYALSLLADARGYNIERRLDLLAGSKLPEVRGKVYDLARELRFNKFVEQALAEIRSARPGNLNPALGPAVQYAISQSKEAVELASRLLTHPNRTVTHSALEALTDRPEASRQLLTREWLDEAASSPDSNRRIMAAIALRTRGDSDTPVLYRLLRDTDPGVATAACKTAGTLQNRAYLDGLLRLLANARLRGAAIDALAAFGDRVVGTLGDVLLDTSTPVAVRRQIPRVLRSIPTQRSVDVLLQSLGEQDLTVRSAVLRALSNVREANTRLSYGRESVTQHILSEARYYYELSAALSPIREQEESRAARLLAQTLEQRLRSTIERLFRLIGLRYPPREIYAAYLAVNRPRSEEHTAAIEFLDNVLERELKRVVLPLFDEDARIQQVGRDLFGLEPRDVTTALREVMRTGDAWLVACAVATAADLKLNDLRPDIEPLSQKAGTDVGPVAQSALLALA